MPQELSLKLSVKLRNREHFRIVFTAVDRGAHIWETYYSKPDGPHRLGLGDVVSWFWGETARFGLVKFIGDFVGVRLVPRKFKDINQAPEMRVPYNRIVCVFSPTLDGGDIVSIDE